MEPSLQHEDLLMKLRAKLNEGKIKLWEPPYLQPDDSVSENLKELATKYAAELSLEEDTVLAALHELQLHSLERSKANEQFKETGCATFRVRVTVPGQKPVMVIVKRTLDVMGSELIQAVAEETKVAESRVKLIFNGKVIKATASLEEQGLKNGAQLMALIMAESPQELREQDTMYMEMKQTRDDAQLLSQTVDLADDDNDYMALEDQSGNPIQLPPEEKRALLVGLALHERGREHIKRKEYELALVLLLEADTHFSECGSSILRSVDNYAVLQVDISWCYLCLRSLGSAGDAGRRLRAAERALADSYGTDGERVRALKGDDANERVLLMRLRLLQGIVACHQNRRDDAKNLLQQAEEEINRLRVDPEAVTALMELGWSCASARAGLRARRDVTAAHHYLADRREARRAARAATKEEREREELGVCEDGTPVQASLVSALMAMGYERAVAASALRHANNHAGRAVELIHSQPDTLSAEEGSTSEEESSPSSESVLSGQAPDDAMLAELVSMGYGSAEATAALAKAGTIHGAVEILLTGQGSSQAQPAASTSAAVKRKRRKSKREKRRRERAAALERLNKVIKTEEDEYLDTSLSDEEMFLAQYKALLE